MGLKKGAVEALRQDRAYLREALRVAHAEAHQFTRLLGDQEFTDAFVAASVRENLKYSAAKYTPRVLTCRDCQKVVDELHAGMCWDCAVVWMDANPGVPERDIDEVM